MSKNNIVLNREYYVDSPVSDVFAFVSDPMNDALWQSSCDSVKMISDYPVIAGCKYEIGFSFLSRKMSFTAEVIEYKKDERYGYRSLNGPLMYVGSYELKAHSDGTLVNWSFDADPGKYFGILPSSIVEKAMAKKIDEDICRLQALLANAFVDSSAV